MFDIAKHFSGTNRRQFMIDSAKRLLGVSVLPLVVQQALAQTVTAQRGKAKRVIYLFMGGAMSQLDTFDPKPGTEVQGETDVIDTNVAGIQVGEYLTRTAKMMDKLAVIRSLSTETGAHEQGQYIMRTGYKEIATTRHPTLGPWIHKIKGKGNPVLPGSVVIGAGSGHPAAGFLSAEYTPVPIGDAPRGLENVRLPRYLTDERFERRMELASQFDRAFQRKFKTNEVQAYKDLYQEAIELMRSDELKAFDIGAEPESIKRLYGDSKFGLGCLLARRLAEHDVKFVEVTLGQWDMHNNIFEELPDKVADLDRGLTALLTDLESRGMLEETLVVVATEFGRSPKINQRAGRNHHPGAFSCLLAGGGVRGGQVYGQTDSEAHSVDENPVSVADFFGTIAYALGIDHEEQIVSPDGRPFKISDGGGPITELFG